MFLPQPVVIGVRMTGALPAGTTATDLVLTLTQMLRAHGVVGKFVEFFGDGLSSLPVADRATLSNMCPEYGATAPTSRSTSRRCATSRFTGRGDARRPGRALHEGTGLVPARTATPSRRSARCSTSTWRRSSRRWPARSDRRTAWRCPEVWHSFLAAFREHARARTRRRKRDRRFDGRGWDAAQRRPPAGRRRPRGSSQARPTRMRSARHRRDRRDHLVHEHLEPLRDARRGAAGAKGGRGRPGHQAVGEDVAGARARAWSRDYLDRAGLTPYLDKLGFRAGRLWLHDLHRQLRPADRRGGRGRGRATTSTWRRCFSGNRNFEGRIHPQVRPPTWRRRRCAWRTRSPGASTST